MRVKLILPALDESGSPLWRPIKYSLFPPLGLATLAGHFSEEDQLELVDLHVEPLDLEDTPDMVFIQVYITNAWRAYALADHYRSKGVFTVLGGLHVSSLPEEAAGHGDVIFLGPADQSLPRFLRDFRSGSWAKRYSAEEPRILFGLPPVRRDLIKRWKYLVPNSLVVSRGCPHHCNFCYKDSFYAGGKSFYTTAVDSALQEMEDLPGSHMYFLDDHLFADPHFSGQLFNAMAGMGRIFQGAATVESIIKTDLVEKARKAGLRSIFLGFESISQENLKSSHKKQNQTKDYETAIKRLHSLGIMINGSFVFGMDNDTPDVFSRTVEWAVNQGIATATFHIMTPYPGTGLFKTLEREGRIVSRDWSKYNTREAVFEPRRMSRSELERGYRQAYKDFYSWGSILRSSSGHTDLVHRLQHFSYAAGWKKLEPLWSLMIKLGQVGMGLPVLEKVLHTTGNK